MKIATLQSLRYLIEKALIIIDDTTDIEVDISQWICHSFLTKNVLTAISIERILNPNETSFGSNAVEPIKIYDPMSSLTLVRNLFESYVNMYYLLIDNETDEEKEFKLLLWERFWRSERQKMSELYGIKNVKTDNELIEIERIEKTIYNSNYYSTLKPKLKEHYKDRKNWTKYNLTDRAERTNIESERVKFMYKFLSQYAHSSSFAMMQFGSANEKGDIEEQLSSVACNYTAALLALTIELSSRFYNKTLDIIEQDEKLRTQIGVLIIYFTKPRKL